MTDPIKDYARQIAEAVRRAAFEKWVRYCDQGAIVEEELDLDAIIASVPRPQLQHHDAPTCEGWWWARRKGKWEAVRVTGWGAGSQDRHVAMVERAGSFTGAVCDAWIGPIMPPDTTEPAPKGDDDDPFEVAHRNGMQDMATYFTEECALGAIPCDGRCGHGKPHVHKPAPDDETHDCYWRRLDDARREDKVVQNAAPIATPTPDIDPEEVRRALGTRYAADGEHDMEPIYAAAEAYLRLREQIDELADFIMAEIPGEPSQSEGAVDTAIRLLRRREHPALVIRKSVRPPLTVDFDAPASDAPDVQAQECRARNDDGEPFCHHLAEFCGYHARVNLEAQKFAQIDAAVAREREDAVALLSDALAMIEMDDESHDPASDLFALRHRIDEHIRARSGAKGGL